MRIINATKANFSLKKNFFYMTTNRSIVVVLGLSYLQRKMVAEIAVFDFTDSEKRYPRTYTTDLNGNVINQLSPGKFQNSAWEIKRPLEQHEIHRLFSEWRKLIAT